MKKHPIQPLENDPSGVLRFKENPIVCYLLDHGGIDLNKLAGMNFKREDRVQFAQLIGYSLSGYSELSYVSDDDFSAAEIMVGGKSEDEARIKALERTLTKVRKGLKAAACAAFQCHPDDLQP